MQRHYTHLDGIRGLAALFVLLYHTAVVVETEAQNRYVAHLLWFIRSHGHYAVTVFIVLSGYCLMLPVAYQADGQIRGGFLSYIKRRARRILPPYYVALILSMVALLTIPHLAEATHSESVPQPGEIVFGVTPANIFAHAFLVHNLKLEWCFSINWAFWSIATEWQIYFAFPTLLWIWRKAGRTATIVAAFYGSLVLIPVLSRQIYDMASFYYLGSFAMGMAAAALNPNASPRPERWSDQRVWLGPGAVGLSLFLASPQICFDIMISAGVAAILIVMARFIQEERTSPFLRLFESWGAVTLGRFSYSLYLIHIPCVLTIDLLVQRQHFRPLIHLLIDFLVGVPLTLALAYGFYLLFERWTTVRKPAPTRATMPKAEPAI